MSAVRFRSWVKANVYSNEHTHRAYPTSLGVRLAKRRARRASESVLAHARFQMRLVAGRIPGVDLDGLAKRYLFEMYKREEMSWRLWRTTRMPFDRLEILRAACAQGGVILSFMHHGQYGGVFPSLGRHGFVVRVAADPRILGIGPNPFTSIRNRQHARTVRYGASRPFAASYSAIRDHLAAGELVALASDMPGTTVARFLGRDFGFPTGAARLALGTGATIVPAFARRDGDFQRIEIGAPLHVGAGDDRTTILERILAAHEPAVRDWPEALERPGRHFQPVSEADLLTFGSDVAGQFFKQRPFV